MDGISGIIKDLKLFVVLLSSQPVHPMLFSSLPLRYQAFIDIECFMVCMCLDFSMCTIAAVAPTLKSCSILFETAQPVLSKIHCQYSGTRVYVFNSSISIQAFTEVNDSGLVVLLFIFYHYHYLYRQVAMSTGTQVFNFIIYVNDMRLFMACQFQGIYMCIQFLLMVSFLILYAVDDCSRCQYWCFISYSFSEKKQDISFAISPFREIA